MIVLEHGEPGSSNAGRVSVELHGRARPKTGHGPDRGIEIQRAKLTGIGVVDRAAYPDSEVAARCQHYAERWKHGCTTPTSPWPLAL